MDEQYANLTNLLSLASDPSKGTMADAKATLRAFAQRRGIVEDVLVGGSPILAEIEGMEMILMAQTDYPFVLASIGLGADAADQPEACAMLLQANLDWAQTAGGTFTMTPETGEYFLKALIPVAKDGVEFLEQHIEMLFETARAWQFRLEEDADDTDEANKIAEGVLV